MIPLIDFPENGFELIEPYGGQLVNLLAPLRDREELHVRASHLRSFQLTERAICDLELLATGGFSPLKTFMKRDDYERVVAEMRLADGTLFPIPITLTIGKDVPVKLDEEIALADSFNNVLAILRVEEIYDWDRDAEAFHVYGTTDSRHPHAVRLLSMRA